MSADLIVYGVIAAGLIFWLRSILGTRHGEERERPNPLTAAKEIAPEIQEGPSGTDGDRPLTSSEQILQLAQSPKGAFSIENKTAENGLLEIAKAEKAFDIHFFGSACQDVFVMVVEAFARGDRETLEDLLRADVYKAFDAAITERENSGETLESEIHSIRKAEIIAAMVENKTSYITVKFTADETRVAHNKNGDLISGHPDKVSKMIDIWTFSHDISGKDPRWLLIETRSEDPEEDNDLVPDTK